MRETECVHVCVCVLKLKENESLKKERDCVCVLAHMCMPSACASLKGSLIMFLDIILFVCMCVCVPTLIVPSGVNSTSFPVDAFGMTRHNMRGQSVH